MADNKVEKTTNSSESTPNKSVSAQDAAKVKFSYCKILQYHKLLY